MLDLLSFLDYFCPFAQLALSLLDLNQMVGSLFFFPLFFGHFATSI